MKKKLILILLLSIFLFSSCSLMRIRSGEIGNTQYVKGIPFYIKVNNFYHVTRYLQTIHLVSFQYKRPAEKEWKVESRVMAENQLIHIKNWFDKLPATISPGKIESVVNEFRNYQPNVKADNQSSFELTSNTVETRLEVDASRTYYLNQRLPMIGTSNLEVELNPDGTLSKAKSTVETQTLAKVLDVATAMLPLKELMMMKLNIPEKALAIDFEIKLSIASKLFLYTLTKRVENAETIPDRLNLKFDEVGYPVLEKDVGFEKKEIKPDSEKKGDATDKKAIEFSGTVALPQEKK